ncbi:hypothetical protein [Colwellia psychrerythraea]|uniref:Uncharacterized protein n=1 Tax=Colwellia psychrerythraea TaxID=28229 RepID=A0A099KVN0_COLPS|nr:hypothetical protein [Colwellia psychrerythraea]KGJ94245.1 hypothetical protein ND2E_1434 [Colwellia psychrerythraea]
MYFWNTKALSEDIKNSKLTDNDWKNYYLAGSIFLTLSIYIIALSPRESITPVRRGNIDDWSSYFWRQCYF